MGDQYPQARLAAVQARTRLAGSRGNRRESLPPDRGGRRQRRQCHWLSRRFYSGFPDWYMWHIALSPHSLRFGKELFKNAVEIPGPATAALGAAARKTRTHVVVGVNERRHGTLGTLYNTLIFFGPDGDVLGVHRKLMPTATERLVHAAGDGAGMQTYDTPYGALGGLICGENTSSLARFALLAQNERIHVAAWPAFPSGQRNFDTIDIRARYHAFEGRVFVISACGISMMRASTP